MWLFRMHCKAKRRHARTLLLQAFQHFILSPLWSLAASARRTWYTPLDQRPVGQHVSSGTGSDHLWMQAVCSGQREGRSTSASLEARELLRPVFVVVMVTVRSMLAQAASVGAAASVAVEFVHKHKPGGTHLIIDGPLAFDLPLGGLSSCPS